MRYPKPGHVTILIPLEMQTIACLPRLDLEFLSKDHSHLLLSQEPSIT